METNEEKREKRILTWIYEYLTFKRFARSATELTTESSALLTALHSNPLRIRRASAWCGVKAAIMSGDMGANLQTAMYHLRTISPSEALALLHADCIVWAVVEPLAAEPMDIDAAADRFKEINAYIHSRRPREASDKVLMTALANLEAFLGKIYSEDPSWSELLRGYVDSYSREYLLDLLDKHFPEDKEPLLLEKIYDDMYSAEVRKPEHPPRSRPFASTSLGAAAAAAAAAAGSTFVVPQRPAHGAVPSAAVYEAAPLPDFNDDEMTAEPTAPAAAAATTTTTTTPSRKQADGVSQSRVPKDAPERSQQEQRLHEFAKKHRNTRPVTIADLQPPREIYEGDLPDLPAKVRAAVRQSTAIAEGTPSPPRARNLTAGGVYRKGDIARSARALDNVVSDPLADAMVTGPAKRLHTDPLSPVRSPGAHRVWRNTAAGAAAAAAAAEAAAAATPKSPGVRRVPRSDVVAPTTSTPKSPASVRRVPRAVAAGKPAAPPAESQIIPMPLDLETNGSESENEPSETYQVRRPARASAVNVRVPKAPAARGARAIDDSELEAELAMHARRS